MPRSPHRRSRCTIGRLGSRTLAKIPAGVGPRFPQVVVLVGATGDLAQRKLLPGLFHLATAGFIPDCRIIGVSLDDCRADAFREARARRNEGVLRAQDHATTTGTRSRDSLDYVPLGAGAEALAAAVDAPSSRSARECRRLHYLSVPPSAALSAVRMLGAAGLVERSRIVMEKPFGTDLRERRSLNTNLHEVFNEEQIFRIDHFLGKEPAQNILAFRFANGLFEPIWNRNFIDHVQIDVPETLGLGSRAGFYETDRRLPRHGGHASVPDSRVRRHGGAHVARARRRSAKRRTRCFAACCRSSRATWCAASTRATAARKASAPESETETFIALQVLDRQLALGGRALLSAHRQAAGRRAADHLDCISRAAEEHVSGELRRRRARSGSSDVRSRGRRRRCRCRSTASGPGPACSSTS